MVRCESGLREGGGVSHSDITCWSMNARSGNYKENISDVIISSIFKGITMFVSL